MNINVKTKSINKEFSKLRTLGSRFFNRFYWNPLNHREKWVDQLYELDSLSQQLTSGILDLIDTNQMLRSTTNFIDKIEKDGTTFFRLRTICPQDSVVDMINICKDDEDRQVLNVQTRYSRKKRLGRKLKLKESAASGSMVELPAYLDINRAKAYRTDDGILIIEIPFDYSLKPHIDANFNIPITAK